MEQDLVVLFVCMRESPDSLSLFLFQCTVHASALHVHPLCPGTEEYQSSQCRGGSSWDTRSPESSGHRSETSPHSHEGAGKFSFEPKESPGPLLAANHWQVITKG